MNVDTLSDRKRVQKAVYLGQLTGVDLSYRYGWYLKGPYSPSLARDYFSLAEAIGSGERGYGNKELHPLVMRKLRKVSKLMNPPQELKKLPQEDWLELLSSVHYLRVISNADRKGALNTFKRVKPKLARYYEEAERSLGEVRLLS